MLKHLPDEHLKALALGELSTAASLRAQQHIFGCADCLNRLIRVEFEIQLKNLGRLSRSVEPSRGKPLFIRHDTADGFIYLRVTRNGRKWAERHWGEHLMGGQDWQTMRKANEHAVKAFREMFPEHRCTSRCCVNPKLEDGAYTPPV